eukprot:scaffold4699_cov117-Skeletonema_dohrnii-CCMP3373.AAC.3
MEVNDPTSASGEGESMSSRWSCFVDFWQRDENARRCTGHSPKALPFGQTLGTGDSAALRSSTSKFHSRPGRVGNLVSILGYFIKIFGYLCTQLPKY